MIYSGHVKITNFNKSIWHKTVAIVRNPYSKLVSIYNYSKMKKSYWHSDDRTTKYPLHSLYTYTSTHTFEEFVIDLCINNKFQNLPHLIPQHEWIITPDNKIVSNIVKLENINNDLSSLLKKNVTLMKINTSINDLYEDYYTDYLKTLIYNRYKLDFELFDYPEK